MAVVIRMKRIGGKRRPFYSGVSLNTDKVQEFIIDQFGEKEWSKAKEEFGRQSNADIIDIFEWAGKKKEEVNKT